MGGTWVHTTEILTGCSVGTSQSPKEGSREWKQSLVAFNSIGLARRQRERFSHGTEENEDLTLDSSFTLPLCQTPQPKATKDGGGLTSFHRSPPITEGSRELKEEPEVEISEGHCLLAPFQAGA